MSNYKKQHVPTPKAKPLYTKEEVLLMVDFAEDLAKQTNEELTNNKVNNEAFGNYQGLKAVMDTIGYVKTAEEIRTCKLNCLDFKTCYGLKYILDDLGYGKSDASKLLKKICATQKRVENEYRSASPATIQAFTLLESKISGDMFEKYFLEPAIEEALKKYNEKNAGKQLG